MKGWIRSYSAPGVPAAGTQDREKKWEAFSRLSLSKKERRAVDRLLSAHAEDATYYSGAAYLQGFKDCASLLKETGIVK